uniref:Uncharacterized protein n=1 Tax=Glossina pallidipes TaxID=7398 RepID=A0A1B0A9Y0_GLOPL
MSLSLIRSSIRKSSTGSAADVTDIVNGIDLADATGDTDAIGGRGDVDGGVVAGFVSVVDAGGFVGFIGIVGAVSMAGAVDIPGVVSITGVADAADVADDADVAIVTDDTDVVDPVGVEDGIKHADVADIADVIGVSDATAAAGAEYATRSVCAVGSAVNSSFLFADDSADSIFCSGSADVRSVAIFGLLLLSVSFKEFSIFKFSLVIDWLEKESALFFGLGGVCVACEVTENTLSWIGVSSDYFILEHS